MDVRVPSAPSLERPAGPPGGPAPQASLVNRPSLLNAGPLRPWACVGGCVPPPGTSEGRDGYCCGFPNSINVRAKHSES